MEKETEKQTNENKRPDAQVDLDCSPKNGQ